MTMTPAPRREATKAIIPTTTETNQTKTTTPTTTVTTTPMTTTSVPKTTNYDSSNNYHPYLNNHHDDHCSNDSEGSDLCPSNGNTDRGLPARQTDVPLTLEGFKGEEIGYAEHCVKSDVQSRARILNRLPNLALQSL